MKKIIRTIGFILGLAFTLFLVSCKKKEIEPVKTTAVTVKVGYVSFIMEYGDCNRTNFVLHKKNQDIAIQQGVTYVCDTTDFVTFSTAKKYIGSGNNAPYIHDCTTALYANGHRILSGENLEKYF